MAFDDFLRRDTNCASGFKINKCGCDFSPVAVQRALTESATGHDGDRVGSAAVRLNKPNQTLAIFSARVVDPQLLKPKYR